MSGSIIVTLNEITNKKIYSNKNMSQYLIVQFLNNIKIGIIYGLFVDAFKLGS